jgi:hypothetical protein
MVMPVPLMVTLAVAPSAGAMLTLVEKSLPSISRLLVSCWFVWAEVVVPVVALDVPEVDLLLVLDEVVVLLLDVELLELPVMV